MANATPTTPKDQFSARYTKGVGVAHRGTARVGTRALWGNTGNEIMNFREFCTHNIDFLVDSDTYQTGGGNEPHLWTLTNLTGVAGAFTKIDDTVQGLALLDVGGATASHGVQIQEIDATGAGLKYDPTLSYIVSWESRGSMTLAEDCDWFVGIGIEDSTFMDAAGAITAEVTDYMGFLHVEDATTVQLVQCGTANANAVIVVPDVPLWTPADAAATKRRLGLRIENNDFMAWYLDGDEVGSTHIGDLDAAGDDTVAFAAPMCSTICLVNNSGAGQATATIDYIASQVTRY